MTLQYTHCDPSQQKLANKFYKKFKTNVSCNLADQVFVALTEDGEVIAALFFRSIDNGPEYLLRSLFVAPEYRGEGVAKTLCRLALQTHKQACFTLCEQELIRFYQALGFAHSTRVFPSPGIEKQIKKGLRLMRRP